jgi:hypothetical protein
MNINEPAPRRATLRQESGPDFGYVSVVERTPVSPRQYCPARCKGVADGTAVTIGKEARKIHSNHTSATSAHGSPPSRQPETAVFSSHSDKKRILPDLKKSRLLYIKPLKLLHFYIHSKNSKE